MGNPKTINMKKLLLLIILFIQLISWGQNTVNLRYPYRVPDWLWKDQLRSIWIDSVTNVKLSEKILKMEDAYNVKNDSLGDLLEKEINQLLNSKLSLLNLERGSKIIESKNGLNLALQLDPNFRTQDQVLLSKAAKLFLEIALDDKVIAEAYENSIDSPTPVPEIYDKIDVNKFTVNYAFMLNNRIKPFSSEQLKIQLKNALTTQIGDPALLVISSYTGNIWWGGSWYNYFYNTTQHLSKYSPSSGFLYIRLNTDYLLTNQDVPFWASKIAHEILHNLGYWHPNYADPAERDKNNIGKNKAFIVAYEFAILKKANQTYNKH